ncbi:MAG: Na+/H+ antiporter [Candidatus Limnocylindrales bacterium]
MHLGPIQLVFIILSVAIALAYLARRLKVAEPILFLLGGIGLALVPDLPAIELEPDVVFLLFLPPILFSTAYFTPIRDFKANARPILLLAIGLVLFTTAAVAAVALLIVPDMSLPVAITLGAIVAPPDAVAATAVFQRMGAPRRLVTILEGESLINDASSLIAYRAGVVAVATGTFSLLGAGAGFAIAGIGGVIVGIVVGHVVTVALLRTGDPVLEIIVSVVASISAYLAAELVGVSGVLATVVAGLITGRRAARVLSPDARLLGQGVWQTITWLINAFVFMLIGLQLPEIIANLSAYSAAQLIGLGLAFSLTVIVARIAWVFPATYLPRRLSAALRKRDPAPSRRTVFVVAWAGMRGAVSLAAALALTADFPQRDLILFITFCVILATLVGQGLTLPWLVRRLGVVSSVGRDNEETHARLAAVEAAVNRLQSLKAEYPEHLELIDTLRREYDHEANHVWPDSKTTASEAERERLDHQAIRTAVLLAEREAVIQLRDGGVINDETLRLIERELDLDALRTGS